jgi:hypothetical protein
MTFSCPACGAELSFKSRFAVFCVCTFCQSSVVKEGGDLTSLGKMALLAPDLSPLQLGTKGRYEGRAFELVGRLKIGWSDGNWTEWYALFSNGDDGWLAAAQGFHMMSFEVRSLGDLPSRASLTAGQMVGLAGKNYQVDDIKECECLGSEGELPMQSFKGRKNVSVDLTSEGEHFAGLDYSAEGTRLYLGTYVDLDALQLTHLRAIDGW